MGKYNPHPRLRQIAPNTNAQDANAPSFARRRYVVLKEYINGWHVGFTDDINAIEDYYWRSAVSEEHARNAFALVAGVDTIETAHVNELLSKRD